MLKKNKVVIDYEQLSAIVEAITPEIINVFLPLGGERKPSHAIEEEKRVAVELAVEKDAEDLLIATDQLQIKVGTNFKVDFYTKDGQVICRDYRGERAPFVRRGSAHLMEEEGHKAIETIQGNRVEVLKGDHW